jgi:hypothetical protein
MSINREEIMLRPEQLVALDNMRSYGVPEDIIARTKKDFEDANFELMATTSRRRVGTAVARKIDIKDYVLSSLPSKSDRQDLAKMLVLITALSLLIDAEVADKAKQLIELDDLKIYDVMDCVRGIHWVTEKERGWGDRDNGGRITALIETLKPDEVEFEVEGEDVSEPIVTGEELPLVEDNQKVEKSEVIEPQPEVTTDESDPEVTTTGRTKRTRSSAV